MPQFSNSADMLKTSQLLTYPILMTHDIEGYQKVHVGKDQIPHLMFAKKILKRYENKHKIKTLIPEPIINHTLVRDLKNSSLKMSKSHPEGCLFIEDSADIIKRKIQRAVTDEQGVNNLKNLYSEFVSGEMPEIYGIAKQRIIDAIVAFKKGVKLA